MVKKEFLDRFSYSDKSILSKIYDKIMLYEKVGKVVYFNEFVSPDISTGVEDFCETFKIQVHSFGVFEEAERKILIFGENKDENFPLKLLKITNKSKFHNLKHKDYLGALMSLGIVREKIGDLVVKEQSCYVPIIEDVLSYVEYNLDHIGKSPCTLETVNDLKDLPRIEFEESVILVSANRIDNLVSSIANVSRSKAEELIKQGKVMLNYCPICEKDKKIIKGSTLTIRGYGKFKIQEEIGLTNSGRIKILIKKFN